jgi:hypothetical protein
MSTNRAEVEAWGGGRHRLAVPALALLPFLLTACAPKVITKDRIVEKPVITYVERRIECPDKEERERLRRTRPIPLRLQDKPKSDVERSAKAMAQLGRYEAEGGWADQVDAALDRCQQK